MFTSSKPLSRRNFLVLSVIGYGLHIALVSLVGWPGSSSAFTVGAPSDYPLSPFMFAKNITFCGAFLLWFLFGLYGGRRFYALFSGKLIFFLFSGMVMVGAILSVTLFETTAPVSVDIIRGVLMGVGISGNFALWQHILCARETPLDAQGLIGGTALGGGLYFLLAWLPGWLICVIVIFVIAPGTALLLIICNRGADRTIRFTDDLKDRRSNLRKGILSLLMPGITIGAIGFVVQTVRLLLPETTLIENLMSNLFSAALILGSAIIMIIFERTRYGINMDIFYQYCAPVIGVALLFLPVLGEGYGYAFAAALYTAFTIASIMAILACNQVARFYNIPPIAMYSLVFGLIYTARLLPVLLFGALETFGLTDFGHIAIYQVASLCICLMFGSYVVSNTYRRYQQNADIYSWVSALPENDALQKMEILEIFGRKAKLTKRETEILLLLREGRNVPSIAKKLCVAENTVRYHCKNIYSKFDVHSKQELFDLLEGERNP